MKNISKAARTAMVALVTMLLAFTLAGCSGLSSSSASSNGSSQTSVAASSSSSSQASSSSGASSRQSSQAASSSGSYAESNLTGTTYTAPDITVDKNGEYTDKDHVALYIHQYGKVPSNYVSKSKARSAGWVSTKGNLWDVLPGKSIGGGGFYNDDGMMPDAPGREWYECDIDYEGGFRNSKRIVYSNDGLIYYTDDHYKTFERLY